MHNHIQQQLAVLNKKIRFFGNSKTKDYLLALEQIGELATAYDVPLIFHHVFASDEQIARKAASVIRKLLTKEQTLWLHLYQSFASLYVEGKPIWREQLKKLMRFSEEEAAHLLGVTSLNRNGYIREASLSLLATLSTPEKLPYLLLRLNDWVKEVRDAAKAALEEALPQLSVNDMLSYHELIEWLGKTERVDLKHVQHKLYQQLTALQHQETLWAAMEQASFKKRLFCWRALREEVAKDASLIDKAMKDAAPEIRAWAAMHLPLGDARLKRLEKLLTDPAIRVRYAALKAIPETEYATYQSLIENMIFDQARSIRELACFALRKLGVQNLRQRYLSKLQEMQTKPSLGVLAGFAERGEQQDILRLIPYCHHKSAAIRATVLTGLHRLGAQNISGLYLQGLKDESGKVRSKCVFILREGYRDLRPELEILLKNGKPKTQKAAFLVLMHHDAKVILLNVLLALTLTNETLRLAAWRHLVAWYQYYGSKLWFAFSEEDYEKASYLLTVLHSQAVNIPPYAKAVWEDLPRMLRVLKKGAL